MHDAAEAILITGAMIVAILLWIAACVYLGVQLPA
jgi:hypothetical protein